MRLALCFLLVILAACCYEANSAKVCEAVKRESFLFLKGSKELLKHELEKYKAPQEAVEAKLQVKTCIDDKLNVFQKGGVALVLTKILAHCAKE